MTTKTKSLFKNKLSIFDITLGAVFLILFVGVFLFFSRKNQFVNIRVKITDQDVLYASTNPKSWYANRFEKGDTETDELGRAISEITNVETFNSTADTKSVYLDIKIKAVYDKRTKLYSAKGTNLVFGSTLRFNFSTIAFNALITESPNTINQKDLVVEHKTITVLARGPNAVEPQVLEKIKNGDTITDSDGNILAQVVSVKLRPGQRVTQTYRGDLLLKNDPYFKDAIITLDVKVKKFKGDEFIFDTVPLKLGMQFPLNFSYESIYPVITGLQ